MRRSSPRARRAAHGAASLVVLTLAFGAVGTATLPGAAAAAGASARQTTYYVSLGDSYAVGYQPSSAPGAVGHDTSGYTAIVAKATHLRLVNFGCPGATTASILHTRGCPSPLRPVAGGTTYRGRTQAAAAEAFIRRHRDAIGLITVSIGGNDITHCASATDAVACATGAVTAVRTNVTALARQLRAAAGGHVPLIGLTYPDVLLGLWVYPPGHPDTALATLSETAFKTLFNPALHAAYGAAGGTLVDVTADTGAYQPKTQTVTLPPYGTIPAAVAEVCQLTWYCTQGNIHARSAGYTLIGEKIVAAYKAARGP